MEIIQGDIIIYCRKPWNPDDKTVVVFCHLVVLNCQLVEKLNIALNVQPVRQPSLMYRTLYKAHVFGCSYDCETNVTKLKLSQECTVASYKECNRCLKSSCNSSPKRNLSCRGCYGFIMTFVYTTISYSCYTSLTLQLQYSCYFNQLLQGSKSCSCFRRVVRREYKSFSTYTAAALAEKNPNVSLCEISFSFLVKIFS